MLKKIRELINFDAFLSVVTVLLFAGSGMLLLAVCVEHFHRDEQDASPPQEECFKTVENLCPTMLETGIGYSTLTTPEGCVDEVTFYCNGEPVALCQLQVEDE